MELTAVSPATDEPIPVGSGEQLIEPPTFYMDRKGEKRWNYDGTVIAYRANSDVEFCDGDGFSGEMADKGDLPHWRPSIHMPRKYARLFGRVSDVKLFRLCRELELARKRTLPRALEWTNEPHPGAYNWWRDEYGCIPRYVYQDGTVAITMLMVRVPYQDLGGQWAGPIPEPREPKESVCPGK